MALKWKEGHPETPGVYRVLRSNYLDAAQVYAVWTGTYWATAMSALLRAEEEAVHGGRAAIQDRYWLPLENSNDNSI
ncbi:hypothetical protein ACO0LG_08605 [Undibacterium sp. Ji42W]|uniref:hypothetical protein n=1 Tax=Undibacterium sp. Ji42W TaxID=3413039 RepID=UPI003BF43FA3